MENKLFEVAKQIEEVEIVLKRVKTNIFTKGSESNVAVMFDIALQASELLDTVISELEDIEMSMVDFDNINLDKHFEGNPVSDYVQAGLDYVSGDETAISRRMEAFSRITETKVVTSEEGATDLLNRILDSEEAFAEQLENALEAIENVLEGTKIDDWTEEQVELARYFLQFQPDCTLNEVEMLTPTGVKIVWKRRRYLEAAK